MMRKFLVLLFSGLLLCGCRENYLAEKAFWKAQKTLQEIKKTDASKRGPEVFDPAIKALEEIVDRYPSSPKAIDSLFRIANLRRQQKKFDEARQSLEKVVQNFAYSPQKMAQARYQIAALYEAEGHWEKAEAAYWDTARYHPLMPEGLYAPIHILEHARKKKDKALLDKTGHPVVEHYQAMLKQMGPIRVSAGLSYSLGLAYLTQGDWQKAKEIWLALQKQFPESGYASEALLGAAGIASSRGEVDSAIQLLEEFLKQYPNHAFIGKIMGDLGMLYQNKKEFPKSRAIFEKVLQRDDLPASVRSDLMLLTARSYQDEGQWPDAEKIYREIETKYPNSPAALQTPFYLANHLDTLGRHEEAKKVLNDAILRYEKVKEAQPKTVAAAYAERLQNLAYADKGEWEKVLANFDQKIAQETVAERKGTWLFLKALVAENHLTNKDKALGFYRSFLEAYPNHPQAKIAKQRQNFLLHAV